MPNSVKSEDDFHPEYLADELLVVTQGSDDNDDAGSERGGSMRESREAGRFGEKGWTESAGMPFWDSRPKGEEDADEARPGALKPRKPRRKRRKANGPRA